MKTWARRAFLGLVLLGLFAGLALAYVDLLVEKAVERGGTQALGTETLLEAADIGLLAGDFRLTGLSVSNPPGFERPSFLTLDTTRLELPLANLLEARVRIRTFELEGVHLDLERGERGTNYGPILEHLAGKGAGASDERAASTPDAARTFTLERLVLRDVQASVNLVPRGGDLTRLSVTVPEVVLTDLASDMSLSELCATIVEVAIQAVLSAGKGTVPEDLRADLRGRLDGLQGVARSRLDRELGELEEELGVPGLGTEARKALDRAGDELGEALDGLLNKKK